MSDFMLSDNCLQNVHIWTSAVQDMFNEKGNACFQTVREFCKRLYLVLLLWTIPNSFPSGFILIAFCCKWNVIAIVQNCTHVLVSIQVCPFGTTCLFMYNIHPQLMSLKQDTLSGCKIRAYLSNSVFLLFRYVLMCSSCIVHCNTVYIYCVRMYVNCSTNIFVCLSCSVSCSVLVLMKTLWQISVVNMLNKLPL